MRIMGRFSVEFAPSPATSPGRAVLRMSGSPPLPGSVLIGRFSRFVARTTEARDDRQSCRSLTLAAVRIRGKSLERAAICTVSRRRPAA
jgi:hypothetical protein